MFKKLKNKIYNILRWSEKYIKTDMVYLVGQSGWLLLGQISIFLLTFLTTWVFANFLEKTSYGEYKFVLSIVTLASLTTLTGMSTAIARSVAKGEHVSLKKVFLCKLPYSSLGLLLLLAAALYYWLNDNLLLSTMFLVASIWIPFMEPLGDYQYILQGKKDFRRQTVYRILQRTALTFGMVSAILLTKNVVIIVGVYLLIMTLTNYSAFRRIENVYPALQNKVNEFNLMFSYGKKLSVMNIFLVAANQLDKILLFHFVGAAQLAIYFFAISLPQEIQGVLGNVHSVAFPKLVQTSTKLFRLALLKKIGIYILLLTIPVTLYVLTAPYIFLFLFPAYVEAVFFSQLFAGTILFTPLSLFSHYFLAQEQKKPLYISSFILPVVFILALLILLPTYGIIGVIISVYIRLILDAITALYFFLTEKEVKNE